MSGLAQTMRQEPDLRTDLRTLVAWLREVLPCTTQEACYPSWHEHPCARARLRDVGGGIEERTPRGLVQSGCALVRLLRYVRCEHRGRHHDGCRAMTRIDWTYTLEERHGIRATRWARGGARALDCFDA